MAEIKRPLYFTSQFLIDRDFIAEQDYHSGLRRLHNISLHTWGIVNGLEVSPTSIPGQVEVSAGMAIDSLGQEIVLTKPVTISGITPGFITIKYTEVFAPEDKYTGAGLTDKFTRATPSPKVDPVASAPDDGSVIKLARVKVDGGEVGIDNSVRHLASSLIAKDSDLTLDSLSLTGSLSIDAGKEIFFADNGQIRSRDNNHRLVFNRVANSLELHEFGDIRFLTGNPISEKMKINAAGNVGVGTTNPGQKLDVLGNIKMSGARTKLFYRGDTDTHIGSLAFYSPNGGATAIITPYDAGGGNIANSTIQFGGFGSFESNTVNLAVSGKVGIGTTTLLSGLSLSGDSEKLDSGNEFAPLGIYRKNTFKALLEGYHSTGEYAYIQSLERNIAVRPLVLQPSGGNVGIGTTTPAEALEVNGRIKAGALTIGPWPVSSNYGFFGANALDQTSGGNYALLQSGSGSDKGVTYLNSPENIRFRIGNGERMILTKEGNVGIGTVTPAEALEVNGRIKAGALTIGPWPANANYVFVGTNALDQINAANYALLQSGAGGDKGITFLNSPENIRFRIGNADQMILTKVGNIGIGTMNPTAKLEVAGGAIRPAAGNAETAGIMFPTNPGGGGSDAAWIRYYARTGESTTLEIGISNDADDHIALMPSGNVGIATLAPNGRLDVANLVRFGFDEGGSGPKVITFTRDAGDEVNSGKIAYKPTWDNGALGIVGAGTVPNRKVTMWDNVVIHGKLQVDGVKTGYVADQFVNNIGETLEVGDVVVIGANQASLFYGINRNIPIAEVDLTVAAYDTRVCGIVCEAYGKLDSEPEPEGKPATKNKKSAQAKGSKKQEEFQSMRPREFNAEELAGLDTAKVEPGQLGLMVTLGAFAHCKVDADIAPINVGDLLTTSPTKGHAQKVLDPGKAAGAIIGKALGSLKKGKGKIPAIVTL